MTNTNDTIRALFLTALMVFSVFAGTVAFAGSAAAADSITANNPSDATEGDNVEFVVEYTNASNETITVENADGLSFSSTSASADGTGNVTFTAQNVAAGDYTVTFADGSNNTATANLSVSATQADESDATLGNGTYWQGQELFLSEGVSSGEVLEIRSDSSGLVTQVTADSNGEVLVDTSDLDGTYWIEDENDTRLAEFEIAQQTLDASFASSQAANGGSNVVTSLTLDSNRGSYDVEITAERNGETVSASTLTQILEGTTAASGDASDSVVTASVGASNTFDANFSGQAAGNYTFTVSVTDTTASSDANVSVRDVGTGTASFNQSSVEVAQGGVAEITVEFSEAASSGTLVIGDESADNYQLSVNVEDGNNDGTVTVLFNTYAAGNSSEGVVGPANNADTAEVINETGLSSILDTGDYEIAVSTAGNADDTTTAPDDVGSVFISERSTGSMTLGTVPARITDVGSSADDLATLAEDGVLTEDTTIATDGSGTTDWLIVQVNATGLEGLFDTYGNFSAAQDAGAVDLTVEQTNPGNNADPSSLNVSASSDAITFIEGEDSYYLAIDSDAATWSNGNGVDAGDSFTTTFSVEDDRLFDADSGSESVSSDYEYVTGEISLDSDPVNVTASDNQTITGTSTWAPGTQFTVRVRNDENTQPRFFKSEQATVQPDGTWNVSLDFSEQSTGDGFTVSTSAASGFSDTEGNVVESVDDGTTTTTVTTTDEGTDTPTETPDEGTDTPTETPDEGTDTPTETPDTGGDGGDGGDETTTTTPGFTAVLGLIALIGAALIAARRKD